MLPDEAILAKFSKARAHLSVSQHFFGMLAFGVSPEAVDWAPTNATDGVHIFLGRKHWSNINLRQAKSEIAHEVLHLAFRVFERRKGRNPAKWNAAHDYAINLILHDAGFEMDKTWLLDDKYRGMTAEQIYNLLPDPPGGGQGSQQGKGKAQGGQGQNNPWGACGTLLKPAQGQDPKELDQQWSIALIQAAQIAKQAGTLPGSVRELIEGIVTPKVDWRDFLWSWLTTTAEDDYDWERTDRRYMPQNIYVPSLYSERCKDFVFAADTSGSMQKPQLQQLVAELNGLLEQMRPERVIVLHADTKVHYSEELTPDDLPIRFEAHGRGGTDYRDVFKWVEKNDVDPQALIYYTDGWCSDFPSTPPGYPVLWAGTERGSGFKPPFGEVIGIDAQ